MLTHVERHERLLYGVVADADVALAAGRHEEGRAALLAALAAVGLELDGPVPDAGEALATAIVLAVAMDDGVSVFVVPDDQLSPPLRAALERCHGVTIDADTEVEHPDVLAAYQELNAAAVAEPMLGCYAMAPTSGKLQAARFAARLSRAYFIHEWL
jgi:hypothetical protein